MASTSNISNNRDPAYYEQFIRDFQTAVQQHLAEPQEEDIFFGRTPKADFSKPVDTAILVSKVFNRLLGVRYRQEFKLSIIAEEEGRTWTYSPDFLRAVRFERIAFDAIRERIGQINETAIDLETEGLVCSRYRRLPITAHNLAGRLIPEIRVLFPQPRALDIREMTAMTAEQYAAKQAEIEDEYMHRLPGREDARDWEELQAEKEFQKAQEDVFAPLRALTRMPSRPCPIVNFKPFSRVVMEMLLRGGATEAKPSPEDLSQGVRQLAAGIAGTLFEKLSRDPYSVLEDEQESGVHRPSPESPVIVDRNQVEAVSPDLGVVPAPTPSESILSATAPEQRETGNSGYDASAEPSPDNARLVVATPRPESASFEGAPTPVSTDSDSTTSSSDSYSDSRSTPRTRMVAIPQAGGVSTPAEDISSTSADDQGPPQLVPESPSRRSVASRLSGGKSLHLTIGRRVPSQRFESSPVTASPTAAPPSIGGAFVPHS